MASVTFPLFLTRSVYRRRRLRDAARLLPVFGFFLLHMPVLWQNHAPEFARHATERDTVYVFVVWALLILCTAAISSRLQTPEVDPRGPQEEA